MIILGLIVEMLWELITFPYYIWKMNWHNMSYSDRQGFKIVFASYGLMLFAVIVVILTT